MATFDLSEFLEDDAIVLEGIRSTAHPDGKAYKFESPSAKVGLWLKNLSDFGYSAAIARSTGETAKPPTDLAKLLFNDAEERDLYQRVMGATLEEMTEDGVSWGRIQKIFQVLFRHFGAGQSIAQQVLLDGLGEAQARANRAARRAPQKKAGSSSSRASTGTPARTRSRTSTRSSRTPDAAAPDTPAAQTA